MDRLYHDMTAEELVRMKQEKGQIITSTVPWKMSADERAMAYMLFERCFSDMKKE